LHIDVLMLKLTEPSFIFLSFGNRLFIIISFVFIISFIIIVIDYLRLLVFMLNLNLILLNINLILFRSFIFNIIQLIEQYDQ